MNNKVEKITRKNTDNIPLMALILLLLKAMNLNLSAPLLEWVEFTTCLVLLITFLLHSKQNQISLVK